MAEIRITIPDDKAQLFIDAAEYHINIEGGKETVTPAIALAWLKKQLIAEAKRILRNHQEQIYREKFVYEDPLD